MNSLLSFGLLIVAFIATIGLVFLVRKLTRDNRGSDPTLAPRRAVPLWSASPFKAAFCLLFITACVWIGMPTHSAHADAAPSVGFVKPRLTKLLTNAPLALSAYLGGPGSANPGFTNGYTTLPTLPQFSFVHAITLAANVGNSNKFSQSTNITIVAYACYDNTLTNFGLDPIFTWSVPSGAGVGAAGNVLAYRATLTNIPAAIWDGATAITFTVLNTTLSNLTVDLQAGITP